MKPAVSLIGLMIALLTAPVQAAHAQLSPFMKAGITDAVFVDRYTPEARAAAAARSVLHLAVPPKLGTAISLTPDQPYAAEGVALNAWKPSFVLGTEAGGEIGLNFWGLHNGGHINLGFTPHSMNARLLDCRLLSAGAITYKVYENASAMPVAEAQASLVDHHLLLSVPVAAVDTPVLVELWPTPPTEVVGFFGCDLSEID